MNEPEPLAAPFYVTGGTLKPGAPSYVERQADTELIESLLAGEFCYVLTARQMGKSSLMARTAKRLEQDGVGTAIVDLSQIGTERGAQASAQWYYGIAHEIHRHLRIIKPLRPWWQERADLPPVQRLTGFFRDLVLEHCHGRVVVFVDEIDSTIGLPFADDFFAALRACFNARATDLVFDRLAFALFGVATPDQLIQDQTRTPFNIGKRIELADFTLEEAAKLSGGLYVDPAEASKRLQRILYWTGGHPYLTQAVCRTVRERSGNSEGGAIEGVVDPKVKDLFLSSQAQREETNLKHARARLEQSVPEKRRLLRLYLRVRQGKLVPDQPTSPLFARLKLTGVVKATSTGQLAVRNRIYETVFTPQWVKSVMPVDWGRMMAWGSTMGFLGYILIWFGVFQPQQAKVDFMVAIQNVDYNGALAAYNALRINPLYRSQAIDLMNYFWRQRYLDFTMTGKRDEGLLSYLQAIRLRDSEGLRRLAENLVGSDYERLKSTLRHTDRIWAVAFSPDSRAIVTGSGDNTARLWDTRSGKPISPPLQHQAYVWAVAFSPDGRTIVTGSVDKSARLWDARSGKPVSPPLQHQDSVLTVAFSPDGRTVVTGSTDNSARLWDARSGRPVSPPLQHQNDVYAVAFSPDGRTVVTGSTDKRARLWDVRSGEPISPPLQHQNSVRTVAFSPDGRSVVTGSWDKSARLWDTRSGEPISPPLRHDGAVSAVAFSPDGRTVVTGSTDKSARLWDARTGKPISTPLQHDKSVSAVAFSPDGWAVVTGSGDNTARLWDARSGKPISPPLQHEAAVLAVAFSRDGRNVVTASEDNTARLWEVRVGKLISPPLQLQASISAMAFSPDGRFVVTGSLDNTARLWDARTGKPVSPPLQHKADVLAVAFSPDGRTIVTGSEDNTARLWDARSSKPISPPLQHDGALLVVVFSPDGRSLMTGSLDNTARLWDARTGRPISPPLQHNGAVLAVAFSPDGRTIVTGSEDNTARLWDAGSGKPIFRPLEHRYELEAVAFSSDGQTIATGSRNGTVLLWDVRSQNPISLPLQHQDSINDVVFSSDGKRFFVATDLWLSTYSWDGKNSILQNSQFLGGLWKKAFRFHSNCQDCLQVVLGEMGNSFKVETLRLDEPSDPPIQGDPQELLKKWQERLGLKFDEKMNLVPR